MLRVDKANADDIKKSYIESIYTRKESDFKYMEFLKKMGLHCRLHGRDTSTYRSKHGYSSKYLKSGSNITDVFTHEEHH